MRCSFWRLGLGLFMGLVMVGKNLEAESSSPELDLPRPGEVVSLSEIKKICRYYGLEELWQSIERDPPPIPFRSDGCTAWVDEARGVDLYPACFLHDLKYWAGQPGDSVGRLVVDAELLIDVAKRMGSTTMAETMYAGVRVGGGEQLQAGFSWGFGRREQ